MGMSLATILEMIGARQLSDNEHLFEIDGAKLGVSSVFGGEVERVKMELSEAGGLIFREPEEMKILGLIVVHDDFRPEDLLHAIEEKHKVLHRQLDDHQDWLRALSLKPRMMYPHPVVSCTLNHGDDKLELLVGQADTLEVRKLNGAVISPGAGVVSVDIANLDPNALNAKVEEWLKRRDDQAAQRNDSDDEGALDSGQDGDARNALSSAEVKRSGGKSGWALRPRRRSMRSQEQSDHLLTGEGAIALSEELSGDTGQYFEDSFMDDFDDKTAMIDSPSADSDELSLSGETVSLRKTQKRDDEKEQADKESDAQTPFSSQKLLGSSATLVMDGIPDGLKDEIAKNIDNFGGSSDLNEDSEDFDSGATQVELVSPFYSKKEDKDDSFLKLLSDLSSEDGDVFADDNAQKDNAPDDDQVADADDPVDLEDEPEPVGAAEDPLQVQDELLSAEAFDEDADEAPFDDILDAKDHQEAGDDFDPQSTRSTGALEERFNPSLTGNEDTIVRSALNDFSDPSEDNVDVFAGMNDSLEEELSIDIEGERRDGQYEEDKPLLSDQAMDVPEGQNENAGARDPFENDQQSDFEASYFEDGYDSYVPEDAGVEEGAFKNDILNESDDLSGSFELGGDISRALHAENNERKTPPQTDGRDASDFYEGENLAQFHGGSDQEETVPAPYATQGSPKDSLEQLRNLVGDGIATGKTGALELDADAFQSLLGARTPEEIRDEKIASLQKELEATEAKARELRAQLAQLGVNTFSSEQSDDSLMQREGQTSSASGFGGFQSLHPEVAPVSQSSVFKGETDRLNVQPIDSASVKSGASELDGLVDALQEGAEQPFDTEVHSGLRTDGETSNQHQDTGHESERDPGFQTKSASEHTQPPKMDSILTDDLIGDTFGQNEGALNSGDNRMEAKETLHLAGDLDSLPDILDETGSSDIKSQSESILVSALGPLDDHQDAAVEQDDGEEREESVQSELSGLGDTLYTSGEESGKQGASLLSGDAGEELEMPSLSFGLAEAAEIDEQVTVKGALGEAFLDDEHHVERPLEESQSSESQSSESQSSDSQSSESQSSESQSSESQSSESQSSDSQSSESQSSDPSSDESQPSEPSSDEGPVTAAGETNHGEVIGKDLLEDGAEELESESSASASMQSKKETEEGALSVASDISEPPFGDDMASSEDVLAGDGGDSLENASSSLSEEISLLPEFDALMKEDGEDDDSSQGDATLSVGQQEFDVDEAFSAKTAMVEGSASSTKALDDSIDALSFEQDFDFHELSVAESNGDSENSELPSAPLLSEESSDDDSPSDAFQIMLVVLQQQALSKLERSLSSQVEHLTGVSSLETMEELLVAEHFAAVLMVRPRYNDALVEHLSVMDTLEKKPHVFVISKDSQFDTLNVVDSRVDLPKKTSEVTELILAKLGDLGFLKPTP